MRIRPLVIFVCMLLLGLSVAGVISGGYYPIALVNGSFILHREFRAAYRGVLTYYEHTRGLENTTNESRILPENIEGEILNALVEQALVHAALKKELGKDFESTIKNRMAEVDRDEEFKKAATTISGLRFEDFRNIELVPQAERDVLTGRFFIEGKKFDEWLREAKRTSEVKIFSGEYFWDGTEVKSR